MKYLLDTDWIIHGLNGNPHVVDKIKEYRNDGLTISMISIAEIYEGIFGGDNPQKHEKNFKEFLDGITVLDITEDVCKKFGELVNYLKKKGELIGDFDLLIASTALINDLTLLTGNIKHFERIKELKIKSS